MRYRIVSWTKARPEFRESSGLDISDPFDADAEGGLATIFEALSRARVMSTRVLLVREIIDSNDLEGR